MGLDFAGELRARAIPLFQPIRREQLMPPGQRFATGLRREGDRGLQLFFRVTSPSNVEAGELSVSNRRSRTISPFSQETVSEWVENRIKERTIEGLRTALQVDPANARVTAHLGRRLADQALKQDRDPDEAQTRRGEADFLTSRAQKLAHESNKVK